MDESEKSTLPTEAEILKAIEEDRVLIERAKRRQAEAPKVIWEAEQVERRLRRVARQLARR